MISRDLYSTAKTVREYYNRKDLQVIEIDTGYELITKDARLIKTTTEREMIKALQGLVLGDYLRTHDYRAFTRYRRARLLIYIRALNKAYKNDEINVEFGEDKFGIADRLDKIKHIDEFWYINIYHNKQLVESLTVTAGFGFQGAVTTLHEYFVKNYKLDRVLVEEKDVKRFLSGGNLYSRNS